MKNRTSEFILHIVCIVAFLLIPIITSPDFGERNLFLIPPFLRDFLMYVLLLLLFYATYYVFIPHFYFKKKYFLFVILLLFCFFIIVFLPTIIVGADFLRIPKMHRPDFRPPGGMHFFFRAIIYQFLHFFIIVILALMLRINNRLKQSEKEKLKVDLSYLKAQINPHFLFNTLNSIYSLSVIKSDQTPNAVIKLSDMMRYVISDTDKDFVPLEKELKYVSDYIELQRIRLENTITLSSVIPENTAGKYIAPLIIIPFVENAFKYGVNPEENSEIKIFISLSNDVLLLEVKNNKVKTQIKNNEKNGLGITNTRQRLQLLYPNKYNFDIIDDESTYSVKLTVNLS